MRLRAECLHPDCRWSLAAPPDRVLPEALKHEEEKPRHAVKVVLLARHLAELLLEEMG